MTTFNKLSDFADSETDYKALLKKAVGKLKPGALQQFMLYKDFPVQGRKVPLLLVDYHFDLPSKLLDPKTRQMLHPAAMGKCESNAADEVVLHPRTGKVPWQALKKYLNGISGARKLYLPPDAQEDDDAPQASAVAGAQPGQPNVGGPGQPMPVGDRPAPPLQPAQPKRYRTAEQQPPRPKQVVDLPPLQRDPHVGKLQGKTLEERLNQGLASAETGVSKAAFTKDEAVAPERVLGAMRDDAAMQTLAKDQAALFASLSAAIKTKIADSKVDKAGLARLDAALGAGKAKTAAQLLESLGGSTATNEELYAWAIDNADVDQVNGAKEKGTAAATLDLLFRQGKWKELEALIAKGWDSGQPKLGGAGYSGFTMPLAHQAAGWMHLLDKDPKQIDPNKMAVPDLELFNKKNKNGEPEEWLEKRKGVARVLKAIGQHPVKGAKEPALLTSYDEVKKSPTMDAFRAKPGTFWGFENVRMPYVQAAREEKKDGGGGADAMVLRMMDMWGALAKLTNRIKDHRYDELMKDPKRVIPEILKEAESADDVKGRTPEFVAAFKQEVETFLKRLVKEPVIEEPEITEARGIKIGTGKFMGAALCKHGLEWLRDNKKVLYYCLDGIDENDFISYRTVKHEQIRAGQAKGAAGGSHDKVITLVELRHIVRNWSTLSGTVKFTRRGQLIADQDKMVAEWADKIKKDKEAAGDRPVPERDKLPDKLKAELKALAIEGEKLTDQQAFEITRAAAAVRAAIAAHKPIVVAKMLEDNTCLPLFKHSLLPSRDTLIADCKTLAEAKGDAAKAPPAVEARKRLAQLASYGKGGDLPKAIATWAATVRSGAA